MNWGAIVLIILGLLIVLGALKLIPFSIWDTILWIISLALFVTGITALFKKFPQGLTTTFAGLFLALILLDVLQVGFWGYLALVIGVAILQKGIEMLIEG